MSLKRHLLLTLTSPLWITPVAAQYALKKARKSLNNIILYFKADRGFSKAYSSAFRLGWMLMVAVACINSGGSWGTSIGTAVLPGVGTVIGAALGFLINLSLSLGAMAWVAKYMWKFQQWMMRPSSSQVPANVLPIISYTNPEKYFPSILGETTTEVKNKNGQVFSVSLIHSLLQKAYQEKRKNKDQISFWGKMSPWLMTHEEQACDLLNQDFTKAVRSVREGDIVLEMRGVVIDPRNLVGGFRDGMLVKIYHAADSRRFFQAKLKVQRQAVSCESFERVSAPQLG